MPLDEDERGERKSGLKLNIKKTKIIASRPVTSWQIDGRKSGNCHISYSWFPELMWTVTAVTRLKDFCSVKKNYDKPRQHIKKQRHHFAEKVLCSQSYGFSSGHVWM